MTRRHTVIGLSALAGLVVLALVAATALTVWSVRRPFPDYDGTADVPRLSADVDILRDEHGIPHIYADTAEDLFRAQAYVHAQDRFWQMDLRRHITAGRLAELFGEDQVETDAFVRTLGWRDVARKELTLLRPDSRRYFDAYADGVNAWMEDRSGGELGLAYTLLGLTGGDANPEKWTAVDSLSWLKAMAWDLRGNVEDEIARALLSAELPAERVEQLYPENSTDVAPPIVAEHHLPTRSSSAAETLPAAAAADARPAVDALRAAAAALDSAPELLGEAGGIGSNSWVVADSLTDSGSPLLANDPHLAPGMPSVWHQVGLHCREVDTDCPFDVVGYSFAGSPGVVIGHNQDVAWGFTNLGADVSDLYLERTQGDSYLVGDEWRPMEIRTETIEVADGDDVIITVRSTRHGPLLSDHDERIAETGSGSTDDSGQDHAVALRWTALTPGRTADAIFALNRARDWRSFRAAAELLEVPSQNLVYADAEGNIGYQAPGRIPIRASGDGRYPAPGWSEAGEWVGYIPFDELPRVLNPVSGVIVAANQPVTTPAYPYMLTADFDPGHRAGRIRDLLVELIDSGQPVDVAAMAELQLDTRNAAAEILVPHLLELDAPEGYYGDGLRLLDGWNYEMRPDSAAAAYFAAVWRNLLRLTFHDELSEAERPDGGGRWFEVMRVLLDRPTDPWWDDVGTENVETRDIILVEAARDARDDMTVRQGKDAAKWEWGRLHALTLTEPSFGTSGIGLVEWMFNRGPLDVGGGPSVVQATGWDAAAGYETVWVPSMRMIVDLGDLNASRWVDLTGVSGHPFHDHYGDQTEPWRDGETLPMRSDESAIRDAAEHTFTLTPPAQPAPTPR